MYRCPPSLGYQHGTADHQQNFVDPDSGAHTQSIDRLWLDAKVKILKKMRGVPQKHLQSHLDHVCWHVMYKSENEILLAFLRGVRNIIVSVRNYRFSNLFHFAYESGRPHTEIITSGRPHTKIYIGFLLAVDRILKHFIIL